MVFFQKKVDILLFQKTLLIERTVILFHILEEIRKIDIARWSVLLVQP
jgi:hypothetical protein